MSLLQVDITLKPTYSQHGRSHPSHIITDNDDEFFDIGDEGEDRPQNNMSQSPGRTQHTNSTNSNDLDSSDASQNDVSESCTPSAGDTTLKRRRASSCDSLKEIKIQKSSSGRPKAADYDDSDKALILSAISYYRTEIGTAAAFLDIAKEAEMLGQVWQDACMHFDITVPITPRIAKLVKSSNTYVCPTLLIIDWQITSRGSQLRGELKSKTRPLVEGFFGFESGLNQKRIAKNREMAEDLKDGKGFIYEVFALKFIIFNDF